MLEKNKDYVEFTLQYTSIDWSRHSVHPEVSLNGYSDFDFPGVPIMDVVCKEFDHKVVVVGKRDFEKMQADVNINAEIAKQWEINYDLLLKKIGFDTVEELVNYLDSEAECDTLRDAIASLGYSVKFARDERRDLSKKLEECEKDYISERDKAEALQTENEQLKKKLEEFSPDLPGYSEFLTALYPEADVEKMVWVTKHIFGCRSQQDILQSDLEYYRTLSVVQAKSIYGWKGATGCSTPEEANELLNDKERRITELHDEVKYTSDKWASANSSNNSWKAAAECNSPKELIEKLNLLRDDISGRSTVIEHYKRDIEKWQKATGCLRPEDISTASLVTKAMQLDQEVKILNGALQEWKEGTGCPGPIAAKALIESGMAYEHGFHEAQEENRKLTEEVDSWKNVTGYSTPEDYMHARINCATPFDLTAVWQDATGCVTPDQVKSRIEGLENAVRLTNRNMIKEIESNIDEWQKFTGCDSPQKAGCKINNLCDEICKLKGDYDRLLELTGYKNEKGI